MGSGEDGREGSGGQNVRRVMFLSDRYGVDEKKAMERKKILPKRIKV